MAELIISELSQNGNCPHVLGEKIALKGSISENIYSHGFRVTSVPQYIFCQFLRKGVYIQEISMLTKHVKTKVKFSDMCLP